MILRRWLIGVLCGSMLCTFAGCGNTTPTPSEPIPEQVEDIDLTLQLTFWDNDSANPQDPVERQGKFTGTLIDGKPSGQGKFITRNSAGEEWYYEGEFTDGTITGQGGCYWPESDYQEVGTYENGLFIPTKPEFFDNAIYNYTASVFKNALSVQDDTISLIAANENLFPVTDDAEKEKAMSMVDSSIEYKHLTKSIDNYLDKMIYFKNQHVVQTKEQNLWGHTLTTILTEDSNFSDCHFLIYDGSTQIYDGDYITFVSLPVGQCSYQNLSGGFTTAIVSIASIVLKN